MIFNEKYYNDIWSTVHRHDYCPDLTRRLVQNYGKCRILDIGTGCGYLVKCLRDAGCDAWGAEISDYALAKTCAPGFVVKGDVRNLPFKDNSFDVVFSQGLWEYVSEADITQAWDEVTRVGKKQDHIIDYAGSVVGEENFVTARSQEWWEGKLQLPKILVTCPVHECKEYSFQRWINNTKSLTYPNFDILVVDNSPTVDFVNRYQDQVPMKHIEADPAPEQWLNRICQSMAVVQKHFLAGNYTHWMNIEADNIPPVNIIETLLKYGQDADWISHCYPTTGGALEQGIGCSLLSRKLMTDFDWNTAADSPDAELWEFVRKSGKYKTVELWNIAEVQHLKE